MRKKCIIIGAGTYGHVYMEYLKDDYKITGFYDDDVSLHRSKIDGVEIKGSVKDALENESDCAVFVPIGNNPVRVRILKEFEDKGFEIPSFIHPQAIIDSSARVSERAVYVLPGTTIMPLVTIDNYVMISIGSNIIHHTHLEEGVFVSNGCNVGANITAKKNAYIGMGATIMTGVKTVGENSLIGAGAVVIKDVPENAVMAGVPAKIIKYH